MAFFLLLFSVSGLLSAAADSETERAVLVGDAAVDGNWKHIVTKPYPLPKNIQKANAQPVHPRHLRHILLEMGTIR